MLIRRRGDSTWRAPKVTAYDDEAALQTLLEQSPDLIPGASGSGLAVVRELSVARIGSLDVFAVDGAGNLTLVECKLRANSEIRRHVVGQLLAYAAGLWKTPYDELDAAFAARAGKSLADAVLELPHEDDWTEDAFRASVAANLDEGRFALVIAVDGVTEELKQIVEYLNEHTVREVRVLALELGYVADEEVEILLPSLYGEEATRRKERRPRAGRWDEAGLFQALNERCSDPGVAAVEQLYRFSIQNGAEFYWGEGATPSVTAYLSVDGARVAVWSCYAYLQGKPSFDLNFDWMRRNSSGEKLRALAQRLREDELIAQRLIGLEQAEFRKRPRLWIDEILAQPGAAARIESALRDPLSS